VGRALVVMGVVLLCLVGAQAAAASGWVSDQPDIPMAPQGELDGISCPSASSDCVAVGGTQTASGADVPLAESWSDGQWSTQTIAPPASTDSDPNSHCQSTGRHRHCAKAPLAVAVELAKLFSHSHLAFGTRVTVKISRSGYVAKTYIFAISARRINPTVS